MNGANLTADGDRRWVISGRLDYQTVPALWKGLSGKLGGGDTVLDLSAVDTANSAGLALLLEAHGAAIRSHGRLRVQGLPDSLTKLGAISGLTPLLEELRA